ncbi:TonB-dependent receptor [Sphingomonas piscis]|uniref:TonB-dependent receptor n=1 Tax=Sphingomonas piscis TaxID=2714943 RepID=A0A6G7YM34_9SPHN|nr:TonB-dependent receptor [Sphingomonas piscis]QIK77810.1 TonB-dependent receptor [Sphingomonas piscis]
MNTEGVKLGKLLLVGSSLAAIAAPSFAQSTTQTPVIEDSAATPQGEGDQIPDTVGPPPATTTGADIVVLGSRVRGTAPVGSTVTALGRRDIEGSAAPTLDRLIKEIPQNFDLGVSENSRGQAGGNGNITYGNTVNLRGIGPYATLVLIDGHRVVNNGRSTDPSVLPTLGVERVEVIADGASAIYGSDAVAGVVNVVARRSLNGVEAFARGGFATQGGFREYAMGVAGGKTFDRGQIMLAYEHVKRTNLSGDDRDFFVSDQRNFGGGDYRITRCSPGNIRVGATTFAIPQSGVTQATAGSLVAGTLNRCNELNNQDLSPEQTYNSVNGTGTFDVNDWVSVFVDGFYSKRSFYRNGAYPTAALTVPSSNAFYVAPPGVTPPLCAASVGAPAGSRCYTIDYEFTEVPPGDTSGFAKSWQVTPGIRVKLPHDWQFEALAGYGKTKDYSDAHTGINNGPLNAALRSNNPATAFDPYGGGRTSQAVLDGIANAIFLAPTNGKLKAYEARLNGSLFSLPGGDVKLATGYERQDFDVALGIARGAPTTPLTFRKFGRTVDSFYGELFIPIFGATNAIPGFDRLEVNAAIRRDKYSDVGRTTNPKIGVNWAPIDGVKFRGNWGTSFRAPTIPEIYGNSNNLFPQNYQNPAGGAPLPGVALSGQNLELKPEEARTWSIGADVTPIRALRLGATFWDVKYENQVIANLSNLAILNIEDQYAGTSIILRGAEAQARFNELVAAGVVVNGASPATVNLFVDGRSQNLGVSKTRGIDFTADYDLDLGADSLRFSASGTYLTSYKVAVTPSGPLLDQRNLIFRPLKFKARGSVVWDHGPMSTRLLVTHVGGYTNDAIKPNQKVGSFTPVDLAVTWRLGGPDSYNLVGANVALGVEVRNLFDQKPPYVNIAPSGNGSGGYDASAANPIGRMVAASIRTKF